MTNPFSRDYKPVLDLTEDIRRTRSGKVISARRQSRMDSDDPKVRQQAIGDLGPLSGNSTNHKLLKGSGLG